MNRDLLSETVRIGSVLIVVAFLVFVLLRGSS
jgi:hypothetical protein